MESLCDADYIPFKEFQLRKSLWEVIEDLVESTDEKGELKKVIGQSLIDETLDLHCELTTLHEIWTETQTADETQLRKNSLPEPPFLRENLEKQISLLVELLKQKLKKQGKGAVSAFLSEEDRKLIKSVSSDRITRSLHSTSPSQANCETPTSDYFSRPSSSLSVDVESLQENMSVSDVDSISQILRDDFEEERRELLKDISYVQNVLIYESDLKLRETQRNQASPSIRDLQTLSSKLEKQVLNDVSTANRISSVHAHQHQPRPIQTRKLKPLTKTQSTDAKATCYTADTFNNNINTTEMRFIPSPPSSSEGFKMPTPPSSGRKDIHRTHHLMRRTIPTKTENSSIIG